MLKTEDDYISGGGASTNGWGAVICEACERSPAVFICKADAASLCAACDADIHSANPLARRHHRVPISGAAMVVPTPEDQEEDENNEDEAASWLLLNPLKITNNSSSSSNNNNGGSIQSNNNTNGLFLLGGEEEEDDEYLNFVEFNGCGDEEDQFEGLKNYGGGGGGDSVVPIEFEGKDQTLQQSFGGVDGSELFESSSKACYSYNNGFLTHAISVSSMEVGVVPESTTTTMSDISISNIRPPKGTIDLFSGTAAVQMPATQLSPMDREARVLRYREKKKTRKFEKTIRYASRKAYAETRPRIKGRFAKRTDVDVQVDRKFSSPLMADAGYGIVPSF